MAPEWFENGSNSVSREFDGGMVFRELWAAESVF